MKSKILRKCSNINSQRTGFRDLKAESFGKFWKEKDQKNPKKSSVPRPLWLQCTAILLSDAGPALCSHPEEWGGGPAGVAVEGGERKKTEAVVEQALMSALPANHVTRHIQVGANWQSQSGGWLRQVWVDEKKENGWLGWFSRDGANLE